MCTWNLLTPPTGHWDGGSPLATTCLLLSCGEVAPFQGVLHRFTRTVDVKLRLKRVASGFTAAGRDAIRRGRSEVGTDQFAWSSSHSGHVLRRWNSARTTLPAPPRLATLPTRAVPGQPSDGSVPLTPSCTKSFPLRYWSKNQFEVAERRQPISLCSRWAVFCHHAVYLSTCSILSVVTKFSTCFQPACWLLQASSHLKQVENISKQISVLS